MKIIIVGGGSAGWMTAATLQSQLPKDKITLIESKNISITGVGESTIGGIRDWTRLLKIEDKDFMKDTDASYILSIKCEDNIQNISKNINKISSNCSKLKDINIDK